ncbi:MAG: hypothetical protein O7E52_01570 [Candidatus Poribacteria bacterium]|nr:hypothetical protein [Candidatus Poribacteria bacterium]
MRKCIQILTGMALVLSLPGLLLTGGAGTSQHQSFEVASVHIEQNATDGDMEVVFQVKGGDDGLVRLKVISPDGRPVIDFKAPDPSTMGIKQFRMESPEPGDVAGLKAAYPEGVYVFDAATAAGDEFHGESTLDHTLPATVSFLTPEPEAENVRVDDLEITWTPVEDLAAYLIEIEQEELDVSIQARLPGSVTKFALPDGFLLPGKEYKLAIGTMTEEGNLSFVETSFATAGNEQGDH